jgi:Rab-GTPase-TBC domain
MTTCVSSAVQFERLVQDELPALGRHLANEGVAPSMYCSHWFMTAFAYALPFDHLLRVWDVFLLEGIKVVLLLLQPLIEPVHIWKLLKAVLYALSHGAHKDCASFCRRLFGWAWRC